MNKRSRASAAFGAAAFAALLCCMIPARADFAPGARVPLGSATSQTVHWNGTAYVVDSAALNDGTRFSIGAAIDSTSRLQVSVPSSTSENALSLRLPASSAGKALQVFTNGSLLAWIDAAGQGKFYGGALFGTTGQTAIDGFGSVTGQKFSVVQYITTGGAAFASVSKTSAYTATTNDHLIEASASGGAVTITLPSAAAFPSGLEYIVKKTDSSANTVTVATTSSQTIDGATTYSLATQNAFIRVQSNGANWDTIGNGSSFPAAGTVRKFSSTIGAITANTPVVIAHGLGTADCVWNCVDSSGYSVYPTVKVDATNVTLTFTSSYTSGTFRIIVEG